MSREYHAKEKSFSKMTRDGLVERSAVSNEEKRVSGREQDFNLRRGQVTENRQPFRQHQTENPSSRSTPDKYRRQLESQNAERTADIHYDGYSSTAAMQSSNTAVQAEPQNTAEPERELPMEAARPTARSFEARSHEAPAGGRPHSIPYNGFKGQNGGKKHKNAGNYQQQRYQPTHQPSGQSNQRQTHQQASNQYGNTPPAPPPRPKDAERQGKLQFSQDSKPNQRPPQNGKKHGGGKNKKRYNNRKPYYNDHSHNRQTGQQPRSGQKPSIKPQQHGTQYTQRFDPKAAQPVPVASVQTPPSQAPKPTPNQPKPEPVKPPSSSQPVNPEKPGRLRFTESEKAPATDKKLTKAYNKANLADAKLDKAQGKLPENRKSKQTNRRRLRFEQDGKSIAKQGVEGATRFGADIAHRKLHEVENENVGVKAAHSAQKAVEESARRGLQFARNRPYRKAARLQKKSIKANTRLSYQKALRDNPKLRSNLISRTMQKRKIKKQYAQAAKKAKKTGQTLKQAGSVTLKAVKAVTGFIARHPHILIIIAIAVLLAVSVSSCVAMFGGGMPAVVASSYLAEDEDIDKAELSYTEWETDLLLRIENIETEFYGYDEYRYNIGAVGHDLYQMMAFLTAMFQDFQYGNIEAYLQALFAEQYQLTTTPVTETRYRPVYDPVTGAQTGTEPYDWYVLIVTLTTKPFPDVIMPYMASEQAELYELLMLTHGNRQYAKSPFAFNWLPNVSCDYGYRVHPISGVKDYHAGIDIAVPVGTDIQSAQDGTVTFAGYNGGYGYVVVVENNVGLITKYAHCDTLSVSAGQTVKIGDVIAKSGNSGSSTGPHLHFEVIKNGHYLNPAYFAETGG